MVEQQIAARGIRDRAVLDAMVEVPRSAFVPSELAEFAHDDTALPIAAGQTISQPYIVAAMVEALELGPDDTVLEVGSGSGYAAAVMSRIASRVLAIERHDELVESSREVLRDLGYTNIDVRAGDGTLGWPEEAPFDAVVVTAGADSIPPALIEQLAPGGRLVMPVGDPNVDQQLVLLEKDASGRVASKRLLPVRFVPLLRGVR